jgi:hypothetical protein
MDPQLLKTTKPVQELNGSHEEKMDPYMIALDREVVISSCLPASHAPLQRCTPPNSLVVPNTAVALELAGV